MSNVILIELIDEGVSSSLQKEGGMRNSNDLTESDKYIVCQCYSLVVSLIRIPPVVSDYMWLKAVKVSHILLSG